MTRSVPAFCLLAIAGFLGAPLAATAAPAVSPSPTAEDGGASTRYAPYIAPVAPTERRFEHEGRSVPVEEAAAMDLACVEVRGQTRCFRNEAQLEAYERRAGFLPGTATAAGKPSARAATGANGLLSIWEHADYRGWRIDTTTRNQWFNLPGSYNDGASSSQGGTFPGGLASVNSNGGGALLDLRGYISSYSPKTFVRCAAGVCWNASWNDEASARLRY